MAADGGYRNRVNGHGEEQTVAAPTGSLDGFAYVDPGVLSPPWGKQSAGEVGFLCD